MELFEEIRRAYAAGETIKGLAKKYGVHRRRLSGEEVNYAYDSLARLIQAATTDTTPW